MCRPPQPSSSRSKTQDQCQMEAREPSLCFLRFLQTMHMKCAVTPTALVPFQDPGSVSDGSKRTVPTLHFPAFLQTVHMKCAVHPNGPGPVLRPPDPRPGTQCDTSATYLRKQLANFRSSDRPQTRGSAQGCALPPTAPRRAHLAGTPLPKAGSLNG